MQQWFNFGRLCTNFLLMTLCSSFLDVVREAGRTIYKELHGNRRDYHEDSFWITIDSLNMQKWSAHGRTAWIWEYMTSNSDVQNFCPDDDPADVDKWQDWLTQEQVIGTMQWLFDNCWRAWPNRMDNFESKMQLWTHYDVLRWAGNYFAPFADGFKYRVISCNLYVTPINGLINGLTWGELSSYL